MSFKYFFNDPIRQTKNIEYEGGNWKSHENNAYTGEC